MTASIQTTVLPESTMATTPTSNIGTKPLKALNLDALVSGGLKYFLLLLLLLALAMPLVAVLGQALFDQGGAWAGMAPWRKLVANPNFFPMVARSVGVSAATALVVVPLAYLFAYGLQRTLAPFKGLWRAIALLPLFAPSLLPGIALVYLFGNQGLFKAWMNGSNIYGFWGIVLGEVFYTFPYALMLLLATLTLADGRLYDAARAMGASPWRTFRTVTLPG